MSSQLIARLLLDAQSEFARAADAVPEASRDSARDGLNAPGWVVAHAAFFHDVWLNVDAQGRDIEACDDWLLAWFRRQEESGDVAVHAPFDEARLAFDRVLARTTPVIEALSDDALETIPERIVESGWPPGTTVGYLVARSVAHLFAHAAELNVAATAAGASDIGLPGSLVHTFGARADLIRTAIERPRRSVR
jgi:hypothetical protein